MTKELAIELFGYLGSFIVLVSFLLTSVFKLRVVNTIGSLIFMTYALIIRSYPTAIMNLCLVLINLHFLWKMSHTRNEYDLVEVKHDDSFLQHLLTHYHDDIQKCFPNITSDYSTMNRGYIVTCQEKPVGITLGIENDNNLDLLLDYSIPEYRDFSIGTYLCECLAKKGLKSITYSGPIDNHMKYLENLGFTKEGNGYRKQL